jgi:transposase-like protein
MIPQKLNKKGQCPICLIKPIIYKGQRCEKQKFCHRCSRSYDIDTGLQRENWAYKKNPDGNFIDIK